ncbi:MAG: hypothetical protein KC731_26605 [Myxococcales bacterium]|nr:hypothetical protein [Myxococcales bacterium]
MTIDPSRMRPWLLALALGLTLGATPSFEARADEVTAQDKETARGLMDVGRAKYAEGDYEAALEAFIGADEIMHVTSTGLWRGKALDKLGRLVEARDVLLGVARIPTGNSESTILADARAEAAELQEKIAYRIPELSLNIKGLLEPAVPTITIDGAPLAAAALGLPVKVDPGRHEIAATAPGHFDLDLAVTIAEAEKQSVTLLFRPNGEPITPPEPEPETADTGTSPAMLTFYIAGGIGAVGLIAGGITGGISLALASSVKDRCSNQVCDPEVESKANTSIALAHVSTTTFAVGGAALTAGLIGLIIEVTSEREVPANEGADHVELRPLVGPGFIGLGGRF